MKTYDIRISRDPGIAVLCEMKITGCIIPIVTSHNFSEQIIKNYQRIIAFSKVRLHFLFFPEVSQSVIKNLLFNISLLPDINIFQRVIKNFTNVSVFHLHQTSFVHYLSHLTDIYKTLASTLKSNVVNITRNIPPGEKEGFKLHYDIFTMENHQETSKNRTAARGSLAFTPALWSHYTLPVTGLFQYGNQHAEPGPLYIPFGAEMTQVVKPSKEHIIEQQESNRCKKNNTLFTLISSPHLVLSGAKFFHYSSIHHGLKSFLRKHNCPNAKKGNMNFKKVLWPIAVNSTESSEVDRISVHKVMHSVHRNSNLGYAGQKYIRGISSFTELIHRDSKNRHVKSEDAQLPDFTRSHEVKNIVRDMDHAFTPAGMSISTEEFLASCKRNRSSDLIHFNPNQSPSPSETIQRLKEEKTKDLIPVSSQKTLGTNVEQPLSVPAYQLYGLADKVYSLIIQRIRREKGMRGR